MEDTSSSLSGILPPPLPSCSLRILIFFNWLFAVFSFFALLLVGIIHITNLNIAGDAETSLVPNVVYLGWYIIFGPGLIIASMGVEAFQRASKCLVGVHLLFNAMFTLCIIGACTAELLIITGEKFPSERETFRKVFLDYYTSVSTQDLADWSDMQNDLSCCGTDAAALRTAENIRDILNGEECVRFISSSGFNNFVETNKNSETFEEDLESTFAVPFCVETVLDFIEEKSFAVYGIIGLCSISFIVQTCLTKCALKDVAFQRVYEEEVSIILAQPSKRVDRSQDLLETNAIFKKKSLNPELKDIYSSSWRMARKSRKEYKKETILEEYLKEFEDEELNQALRDIEVVDGHLDRNQPRKVSMIRFPGIDLQEDATPRSIHRVKTSATLGRVQAQTPEPYNISEGDSIMEDMYSENENVQNVRGTDASFL